MEKCSNERLNKEKVSALATPEEYNKKRGKKVHLRENATSFGISFHESSQQLILQQKTRSYNTND